MAIAMLRRGLTRLELLVVLAIIVILTGILLPVFAKARGQAPQRSCLWSQRQAAHTKVAGSACRINFRHARTTDPEPRRRRPWPIG